MIKKKNKEIWKKQKNGTKNFSWKNALKLGKFSNKNMKKIIWKNWNFKDYTKAKCYKNSFKSYNKIYSKKGE